MQSWCGLSPIVEQNYETLKDFQTKCRYMTKVILNRISNALGMTDDRSLNLFNRNDFPSKRALACLHWVSSLHFVLAIPRECY